MSRIEVDDNASMDKLYELVADQVPEAKECSFVLTSDPQGTTAVPFGPTTLRQLNCRNGEMIFLSSTIAASKSKEYSGKDARMLDVDRYLEGQSGRITRKRDPKYCKHGEGGMCSHCQPLEPYDENYAEQKGIKHLSFQAYLRKLGKKSTLEEPNYKVRLDCARHVPYPKGICSQCQPSAITLSRQPFRMTDHVEFETPALIETFLGGWRRTGYQCFGWLYGRYEPYMEVPLGVKAVVSAIYEPKQDGSVDGFILPDDEENMAFVDRAAKLLGLQKVGMIYTDLRDDGSGQGKVKCRRGAETFFLSSAEILFMAEQQKAHPNPCYHSKTGEFGSKFVTVVLSGDEAHDVGVFAYQVSLQATALVEADLISATTDAALMMVKPSSPMHYVPDVLYSMNQGAYGAQVLTMAKPTFPVEYLLVSLSHGFPVQSRSLFASSNYVSLNKSPTMQTMLNFILPVPKSPDGILRCLSNFNLFVHMYTCGLFTDEDLQLLAQAIICNDQDKAVMFVNSPSFGTLLALSSSSSLSCISATTSMNTRPISLSDGKGWTCPHCTFINENGSSDGTCEVCSLPREWNQ